MYFPDRGCVRPLRHLYGYATAPVHLPVSASDIGSVRRRQWLGTFTYTFYRSLIILAYIMLVSRVVSVLDSGAEGHGFKSQPRRCRVTVLGKLFITPVVPLFTKQRNR